VKSLPLDFDRFEFSFPHLDTDLQVEVRDGDVTILATRDTFSDDRKAAFVHELAAEGFIPDAFMWYSPRGFRPAGQQLAWRVDSAWFGTTDTTTTRTRGLYFRALSYSSALAAALFLGLLVCGNLGNGHAGVAAAGRPDPVVLPDNG
jgi:hypothetical protein